MKILAAAMAMAWLAPAIAAATGGAEPLVKTGEARLLSGDAAEAARFFELAASRREPRLSDRALYLKAVALLMSGRHSEAREAYADYLLEYRGGSYVAEARLGIAAANERLGRTREAIEIYRAVVAQHPRAAAEPWILGKLAESLSASDPEEALRYKRRLSIEYPGFSGGGSPPRFPTAYPLPSTAAPPPLISPARTAGPPRNEAETSSVPPRIVPPSGSGEKHFLQAGAFGVKENAEKLLDSVRQKGLSGRIVRKNDLHVVQVGPFPDRASAEGKEPEVRSITGGRAIVIKE